MIVKKWRYVLLSSVTAIAIAIPERALATSYFPCGYIFYDNASKVISPITRAEETRDPTAKAEVYYLAADDCRKAAKSSRKINFPRDWYAGDAVKYYSKAIALNPGKAKTYLSYTYLGEIYRENEDYS